MRPIYWLNKAELENLVYVHSRSFVNEINEQKTEKMQEDFIYREHIYIEKYELIEILEKVISLVGESKLRGNGIELGSGCAAISIELVRKMPLIESMRAIEIVPEIVEKAACKLIELNTAEDKVIPDRKSTRLNSSHIPLSRMPSSA